MPDSHRQAVSAIAAAVKSFYDRQQPFRVYHGTTNSTRTQVFKRDQMVDVSALSQVLAVDLVKRTVLAQANVPMDELVRATLPYNLVPPVVMEFPGITVGGGLQGSAGESSSFKWGGFNRTINWFEMVLANGEVVKASAIEKPDLYYGAAGSFGTLGVVTVAEIQLIPAKKYVALTYRPVTSFEEVIKTLQQVVTEDHDYIDGIMFDRARGVIMTGKLTDEVAGPVRRFTRARDSWFYLHAQTKAAGEPQTEVVPLWDYLFRYDRGAFWTGYHAFRRFRTPFNRVSRFALNPLFKTRKMYQALQASGLAQEYIIQDLALPQETALKFLEYVDTKLGIYPLWLCPLRADKESPLQYNHSSKTNLLINVGVWGPGPEVYDRFIAANRELEAKVTELKGLKWLYAHAYYTEDEFWRIYDRGWYDKLRVKYHATHLPTIYDKVKVGDKVAKSGRQGIKQALLRRNRLPVKE